MKLRELKTGAIFRFNGSFVNRQVEDLEGNFIFFHKPNNNREDKGWVHIETGQGQLLKPEYLLYHIDIVDGQLERKKYTPEEIEAARQCDCGTEVTLIEDKTKGDDKHE